MKRLVLLSAGLQEDVGLQKVSQSSLPVLALDSNVVAGSVAVDALAADLALPLNSGRTTFTARPGLRRSMGADFASLCASATAALPFAANGRLAGVGAGGRAAEAPCAGGVHEEPLADRRKIATA